MTDKAEKSLLSGFVHLFITLLNFNNDRSKSCKNQHQNPGKLLQNLFPPSFVFQPGIRTSAVIHSSVLVEPNEDTLSFH